MHAFRAFITLSLHSPQRQPAAKSLLLLVLVPVFVLVLGLAMLKKDYTFKEAGDVSIAATAFWKHAETGLPYGIGKHLKLAIRHVYC